MVTNDEKLAFAKRLNEALDDAKFAAKHDGRQTKLGQEMGVSQKGARKWLEGEAIPETGRLIEIAKRFNVAFEWLATGRGAKHLERSQTGDMPHWPFAFSRSQLEASPPEIRQRINDYGLALLTGFEIGTEQKSGPSGALANDN